MNRWYRKFGLALLVAAACGEGGGQPGGDAATLDLTGVYTCAIEAVDDRVICGGPVYRTDLEGPALPMTIAQTGDSLEVGIWGRLLTGNLAADGFVRLQYRDPDCDGSCSPTVPFIIDVTAVASPRQLSQLDIRMHQALSDECLKTYRGVCASN